MKVRTTLSALLAMSLLAPGCMLRSTEDYQKDTRALVDTQTSAIKDCLDATRANDPNASGDVVVNFAVEKKTGMIANVEVDAEKSTAPASLQACVTDALGAIDRGIDPGDMAPAQVTATWSLQGG